LVKSGEIESVSNNDRGHPSTPVCEWHVDATDSKTRARKLLMYVAECDSYGNPPSIFLGPDGVNVL
jgi:hypothetical protein